MTRCGFYELHIPDSQMFLCLFEPSGELAQEYLRIRYMQFIEITASHCTGLLFVIVLAQTFIVFYHSSTIAP